MTDLEKLQRRNKRLAVLAFLVVMACGAILGVALAYFTSDAIQKGVDPLEARVSAVERTLAEMQDERRP